MQAQIELFYSQSLGNFEEDENYIYVDAVVLIPGVVKRSYGDLLIEADELKKSAESLKGKPVLIEHKTDVNAVVGQVIESFFDEESQQLKAKLKILKKSNDRLIQLIKDKIITKLSAGFKRILEQIKPSVFRAKDIEFQEVSIVLSPAVEEATILKKEVIDMPDIETLTKEKAILQKEVETLKGEISLKESEIEKLKNDNESLKNEITVLKSEIENLKNMAEVGKKYADELKKDAEKFVKIVDGEDSPILSLIDKAEIDELGAIVKKYEELAKEKLKSSAQGGGSQTFKAEEFNIEKASYEDLKKFEEKLLAGGK